ncbi:MAG: hypothetical protein ACO3TR_08125, partial [Burkholderiaceae bacterium]
YEGGYDDYLIQRARRLESLEREKPSPNLPSESVVQASGQRNEKKDSDAKPAKKLSIRLTNKEREALATLPEQIENLEKEIHDLQQQLADPHFYKQGLAVLSERQAHLAAQEAALDHAMNQWELLLQREAEQKA